MASFQRARNWSESRLRRFALVPLVEPAVLAPRGRVGDAELTKRGERLFFHALDRDMLLWEMWLVEGLDRDRFAIISKTHHCMLDGISGVDLATVLMDTEPSSDRPPPPLEWHPRP